MNARNMLARRLAEWAGFDLERGGRGSVLDRLITARTEALRLASPDEYVASLTSPSHPEVVRLIEGLTIGHTWFFRDSEQTAAIASLLPSLVGPKGAVECWVAGCSTGEEAYTLALLGESAGVQVEVLATDINSDALERARAGQYARSATRNVPASLLSFFRAVDAKHVVVDERLKKRVRFERHNLVEAPPRPRHGDRWPLVVCRNVLIYFRRDIAAATIDRLATALAPGGFLFLGANDALGLPPPGFDVAAIGNRYALRRAKQHAAMPAPVRLSAAIAPPKAPPSEPRETTDALLERALAKLHEGAHAEALALAGRVLEMNVLSPEAHLISGVAFYLSDDPGSALRALRSALLLDPDEWAASFYLALTYDQFGRTNDALREYRNTEVSSRTRRSPTRFAAMEAWKDEIVHLARARSRR